MHHDKINYPSPIETYELWEEDEKAAELGLQYKDIYGQPLGFVPPFAEQISMVADKTFPTPAVAAEQEEQYDEYVLSASQIKLICKALDALVAAKGEQLTA